MEASRSLPSDEEITSAVWEILRENMDISRNEIKTQLETNFQWDLSERKNVLKVATASYLEELEKDATQEDGAVEADAEAEAEAAEEEPVKRKGGGFSAPVQLATVLADFLGEVTMPRTEVTKRIWVYIKEHDLQNPADRREILCDEKLEAIFNKKKIMMFKMTKVLSTLMKSVDSLQDIKAEKKSTPAKPKAAVKVEKGSASKAKKPEGKKGSGGGFGAPVQLAAPLAELLGDDILARTEVTKRVWDYIKEHDLQDPSNRREIICDAKLESVLGVKSINMFKLTSIISKMLSPTEGSVAAAASNKRSADDESDADGGSCKKKQKKAGSGEKRTGGFGGSVRLSESLACVLNAQNGETLEEWPRTHVVKVMWQYIHAHNLQNPENRREILLDSTLQEVFKTKKFTMFEMSKFLKDHLSPGKGKDEEEC